MYFIFKLSRDKFRHLLNESTSTLNQLQKKLGKCVAKARPYFDLLKIAKQVSLNFSWYTTMVRYNVYTSSMVSHAIIMAYE